METFYEATGCRPPRSWYSDLDQAVGDAPANLAFWYDVCKAYVGQGWNPRNVQAMLDYYHRREIPDQGGPAGGNGSSRRSARSHGRRQESTWTEAELNQSRIEALATPPIWIQCGYATLDEFLDE